MYIVYYWVLNEVTLKDFATQVTSLPLLISFLRLGSRFGYANIIMYDDAYVTYNVFCHRLNFLFQPSS